MAATEQRLGTVEPPFGNLRFHKGLDRFDAARQSEGRWSVEAACPGAQYREDLALKNEQTKVTIALSSESISFFKEAAEKHHTQYQKMIRQLLDEYVAQQKQRGHTS